MRLVGWAIIGGFAIRGVATTHWHYAGLLLLIALVLLGAADFERGLEELRRP